MNNVWLPRAMIKMVLSFFKRSVKHHTGTDIDSLDVIGAASTSFIPARFGCARCDHTLLCLSSVRPSHPIPRHGARRGERASCSAGERLLPRSPRRTCKLNT